MTVMVPTEEELATRVRGHLAARPGDPGVVTAWRAYLAALIEWGLLDIGSHERLVRDLPVGVGVREVDEILLGYPADTGLRPAPLPDGPTGTSPVGPSGSGGVPQDRGVSTEEARFRADVLDGCRSGDLDTVVEVWWSANRRFPAHPLSERLGMAERAVRYLLERDTIRLVRGPRNGPRIRRSPVEDDSAVLREWNTWTGRDDPVIWIEPVD